MPGIGKAEHQPGPVEEPGPSLQGGLGVGGVVGTTILSGPSPLQKSWGQGDPVMNTVMGMVENSAGVVTNTEEDNVEKKANTEEDIVNWEYDCPLIV